MDDLCHRGPFEACGQPEPLDQVFGLAGIGRRTISDKDITNLSATLGTELVGFQDVDLVQRLNILTELVSRFAVFESGVVNHLDFKIRGREETTRQQRAADGENREPVFSRLRHEASLAKGCTTPGDRGAI